MPRKPIEPVEEAEGKTPEQAADTYAQAGVEIPAGVDMNALADMVAQKLLAAQTVKEKSAPAKPKTTPGPWDMVPVHLPIDMYHKEPLPVRLNDYEKKIQRGVTEYVPYCVFKMLEESEAQDANTIKMVNGMVENYNRTGKLGG